MSQGYQPRGPCGHASAAFGVFSVDRLGNVGWVISSRCLRAKGTAGRDVTPDGHGAPAA
jgi:hypothetical protein